MVHVQVPRYLSNLGTEDVYDFTAKCFQIELLSSGVDPRPYESIAAMSCPRFGGGNLAAYEWKLYVMAGACNCAANMRNRHLLSYTI